VAVELQKDAAVSGQRHLNLLVEAHPLDRGEPVRDTSELSIPPGDRSAVATREPPILADELEASRIPRPRLRLDRHYRSGGAFYCQYRVFGAALDATTQHPRVRASYAIVRAGHVIKDGPPSAIEPTSDGHLLRLLGFGLAGFEPGDYTLVLRVTDEVSGKSCETNEPFTIIPAEG
jgi:hypothetical protein